MMRMWMLRRTLLSFLVLSSLQLSIPQRIHSPLGVQAFVLGAFATAQPGPPSSTKHAPRHTATTSTSTTTSTQQRLHLNDPSTWSQETVDKKNNDTDAYHLLWSPRALKKFACTIAVLLLVPRVVAKLTGSSTQWIPSFASSSCHGSSSLFLHKLWNNLLLPLAASSCCLLQLALNVLALGCAGWNKFLGPVRPYFLAWLVVTSLQPPLPSYWILVGRGTVAFLPEALDWYNNFNHRRTLQQNLGRMINQEGRPSDLIEQGDEKTLVVNEITLEIPTMGCVACINSINSALQNQPGVVSASSVLHPLGLKGGSAIVQLKSNSPTTFEDLVQAVTKAGFGGATVEQESVKKRTILADKG